MKCNPLAVISSAITGTQGYSFGRYAGAYLSAIIGAELEKKIPEDITITFLVTIVPGKLLPSASEEQCSR
ncbi:MAG: hypothetical protein K2G18_06780 [Bacteroidales bacterium]|nr:hypothetical protein [Bacteroidales bacterium]